MDATQGPHGLSSATSTIYMHRPTCLSMHSTANRQVLRSTSEKARILQSFASSGHGGLTRYRWDPSGDSSFLGKWDPLIVLWQHTRGITTVVVTTTRSNDLGCCSRQDILSELKCASSTVRHEWY
jgi:hypothetical protein